MHTIYYTLFNSYLTSFLNAIHGMIFKFYWVYKGCISAGDLGKQPPITGVGTNALMKLVINASKALGISDEALQTIEKKLKCSKIRQDEEEALDDWTVIIYKLSKVVSILPPLSFCRSKSTISPTEYRNLGMYSM